MKSRLETLRGQPASKADWLLSLMVFTALSAFSDFALSSETPDFAPSSETREASSDKSALTPEGWRLATPGYEFRFPQDHGPHPDYQTEWWYLTGNLQAEDGREFGYELTFFRYGYRSPSQRTPVKSRFVMDDVKFAHFTVTDVRSRSFHVGGRTSRGAYGDAGFLSGSRLVWIGDWELDEGDEFPPPQGLPPLSLVPELWRTGRRGKRRMGDW